MSLGTKGRGPPDLIADLTDLSPEEDSSLAFVILSPFSSVDTITSLRS